MNWKLKSLIQRTCAALPAGQEAAYYFLQSHFGSLSKAPDPFPNLEDALRVISHQSAAPIAAALLRQDEGYLAMVMPSKNVDYIAATRMRLDVTQLPKPLQVNALAGHDWSLDSGWYRWIVRPAEAISAGSGKSE